ncbi:unnamed protein product [Camellia sinensis]
MSTSLKGSLMASMTLSSFTTALPATPSIPPNLVLLISNLNSLVNVKVDSTNYNIWKNQVQNILRVT